MEMARKPNCSVVTSARVFDPQAGGQIRKSALLHVSQKSVKRFWVWRQFSMVRPAPTAGRRPLSLLRHSHHVRDHWTAPPAEDRLTERNGPF